MLRFSLVGLFVSSAILSNPEIESVISFDVYLASSVCRVTRVARC